MDFSGIASNVGSSAIYDLIKKLVRACQTVSRCKKERENLQSLLERMHPDVKDIEEVVSELLKLELQVNLRQFGGWFKRLKTELDTASKTVDECSRTSTINIAKTHSLSKKMTAQIEKINRLEQDLIGLGLTLQTFRCLSKNNTRTPQQELPSEYWKWVDQKDAILNRAADTARRQDAAVYTGDGSQHPSSYSDHSYHSQYRYTGDASQHASNYSYSYVNDQATYAAYAAYAAYASQYPSPDVPGPQYAPSAPHMDYYAGYQNQQHYPC